MLRVLIVDDSATARQLLASILGNDPEIEIVGQAVNGEEAVRLTQELRPDVLTIDIHMPLMNGMDATRQIMSVCPTPIVICSASTLIHEVDWAMKALQAGALTLLLKPPGPDSPDHATAAKELIETVKAMAEVKVVRRRLREPSAPQTPSPQPVASGGSRAVAIAASTGGPPAIQQVLSCLPAEFNSPVLVVQHIASGFTEGFVAWLNASVSLHVKLAEAHELMLKGTVYIAPEGRHLGATTDGRVLLSSEDPIGGFRPSATHLFASVGKAYRQRALAVILTGMGSDGVAGLKTLREYGGQVIAQDKESSIVYGMPGAAKQAGVVDSVLPPDRICEEIRRATASFTRT